MAQCWQPQQQGLLQTVELLKAVLDPSNHQRHEMALQQLEQYRLTVPDFNCYLTMVLSKGHEYGDDLRRIAGLKLKNNLKDVGGLDANMIAFIRTEIIAVLQDPNREIRRTGAIAITGLLSLIQMENWPDLLPSIIHLLDSGQKPLMDGALCALELLSEDHTEKLCENDPAMTALIPKLLTLFTHESEIFRQLAVHCLNQYLFPMPQPMITNMANFIEGLLVLHMDTNAEVRKRVCQALVMLVEVRAEYLLPRLSDVIQRLMWSTEQDPDYDVKKEACEFWSSLCESDAPSEALEPFLPQLVPVLLNGMKYSEDELIQLGADEEDDANVPDREQDINPAMYAYKAKHSQHEHGTAAAGDATPGGGDDDDDDDDDDDEDDEEDSEWTLRKCSAAGLDIISGKYESKILDALLPPLHEKLNSQDWLVRESAILAAGAIATGCVQGLIEKNYLPALLDHLVKHMVRDPKPLVRSITCWTLSRYAKWVCEQPPQLYLPSTVEGLLNSILDSNKKVQEAACSAFATLEEEARLLLVPYLEVILKFLTQAFVTYQARNLLVLYDALGSLADSVEGALNQPQLIQLLMPPLIQRWNAIADTDKALFPLLECLTSIVQALGSGFEPYTPPVFKRCVNLVQNTLALQAQASAAGGAAPPGLADAADDEFIVCSLDLISGLAEGLESSIESLVGSSNLLPLLVQCCQHRASEVRQSAFALVGDLAKACIVHLRPHLPTLLPLMTVNLNPEHISVCNNACWAIGEIAVQVRTEMQQVAPTMMQPLVAILRRRQLTKSLLDNTAITVGRMVYVSPEFLAAQVHEFIQPLCETLCGIRDDVEKEDAFKGLVMMVQRNPQGVVDSFDYLCRAFCSWKSPAEHPEVFAQLGAVLVWFKQNLEAQNLWVLHYSRLDAEVKEQLMHKFGCN